MKILYTGAVKQGAEQLDPNKSLGHLVSGSQISNDQLANLFPNISSLSLQTKKRDTKMIALYNDDGVDLANLQFSFDLVSSPICKYKIAFVNPTIKGTDSCFEEIQNSTSLPYYATFNEITPSSVFTIPSMLNATYLGIWVTREFNIVTKKTCADWSAELITPPTVQDNEHFQFTLTYSDDFSSSI